MEIPVAYAVTEQDIVVMEEAVGIYQHPIIPIRVNGTVIESIIINETPEETENDDKECMKCCFFLWMVVILLGLLSLW